MRLRSSSSEGRTVAEGRGVRGRLQKFFRGNRSPTKTSNNTTTSTDGLLPAAEEEPEVFYTFKDYLEMQQFSDASQLLIDHENQLFPLSGEPQPLQDHDNEIEALLSQRQDLELAILKTFGLSLNREVTTEALTSAVAALRKENDQDIFWMQQKEAHKPKWRPVKLRDKHDKELKSLVEDRMDFPGAQCSSSEAVKGSSLQNDVWGMGRQLKQDLETVVETVDRCYPKEMDICNFYALLFHHVFGARLRKIAEFGLDDNDCTFILRWVNEYYPEILQKPNLSEHINAEDFGKLLPPSLLQPLEEQYMTKQQGDMKTYIDKVLNEAKQMWTNGEMPNTEDGCFVSETAFDIIQVVNGAVKTAETVLADRTKAQSLTSLLQEHLLRYKTFLDEVIRSNKPITSPTVKANLHCIQQFSNVLVTKSHMFPEDVRVSCLFTLREMQRSAQNYLLTPLHAELKPLYRKLSSDWLKGAQFKKLLENIESKSQNLQGLGAVSHQELMGRFHLDVSVEYIKRLIRADKLKDSKKQQEAHDSLKRDAENLHLLFSKMGSQEEWLKDVLVRIAELLKLQDLAAVQMHVAEMGTFYKDFSEKHVSAILKLKSNFSKANRLTVKETLRDTLNESTTTENTNIFFSFIPV